MAHFNIEHPDYKLSSLRQQARQSGHLHHAQMMLVAASITAAGIVAVAATVMTTLL
jgi:hypothetical protein